jgi:Mn-dependent DtxR family transcriptional regulator
VYCRQITGGRKIDKLSLTLESYLDAVYELSADDGARLTDIAKRMNVTKSTASAAMTALAKKHLIESERYQHIRLTESGKEMAESATRKQETIYRFFSEILKLDDETADVDADAIKHIISDKAVKSMRSRLQDMPVK